MSQDNLFTDILKSILTNKKEVELTGDSDYPAYQINKVLCNYKDSILYANMMNIHPHTPKKLQYQYLLNTVRSMKRPFNKVQKSKADKDLECVKLYFGYSNEKAKDALRILSDEQIALIREKTDKGGVRK
jgi:K+ transporter